VPEAEIARLLTSCPDRPGIVAAVAGFLFARGANILSSDQHSTDPSGGRFLMRVEFDARHVDLDDPGLPAAFEAAVAERFAMTWRMTRAAALKRVAILVSREDHCLVDLLWRFRRRELAGSVVVVASNHPDLGTEAEAFGAPFVHVPVTRERRAQAEEELLAHLAGQVDLVVLARYMQILSGAFLERVGAPVINIHHSFLPAFVGADPYRRAHDRGVKLIGATAHYATEELDAGPIIEQDVERVDHRHAVADLVRVGRDIERVVLARAVRLHLDDRVLVHAGRTIVF
jgi:formyltetrahydrofolate deformylase